MITTYLSGKEQLTNLTDTEVLKILADVNKISDHWIVHQHLVHPVSRWWKKKKKVVLCELLYRLGNEKAIPISCNEYQIINFYHSMPGIHTLVDIGEIAAYLMGLLNGYDEQLLILNQDEVNTPIEVERDTHND